MKPTPQVSSERGFPFTDYNYQSTPDASHVATKQKRGAHRLHGFWRLGAQFHGGEAVYRDAADFLVFTLMGVACAWPIVSVSHAIARVFLG